METSKLRVLLFLGFSEWMKVKQVYSKFNIFYCKKDPTLKLFTVNNNMEISAKKLSIFLHENDKNCMSNIVIFNGVIKVMEFHSEAGEIQ